MNMRTLISSTALIALLALSGCAAQPSQVVVPTNFGQQTGIAVSGAGEVEAAPDIAVATLGVEVRSTSAKEASDALTAQMNRVVARLKEMGVAPADIQTAQLNVYLEHVPMQPVIIHEAPRGPAAKESPESAGQKLVTADPQHRATNTVTVKIRKLEQASDLISAALDAGANTLHGIQFDIEDKEPLIAQARKKAMEKAKTSATELAKLAGVELGTARLISENASYSMPRMMSAKLEMAADGGMPVEGGTLTISHHVDVTYDIVAAPKN